MKVVKVGLVGNIRDLITMTSKVQVLNVEKRSNEHAYYGSFRVTINRSDFDRALNPAHWPAGWSVREYFHARKKARAAAGGVNGPQNVINS